MIGATPQMESLLDRDDVALFQLVELILDNGLTYRYSDLPLDIEARGATWTGGGRLVSIEPLVETDGLAATGAEIVLSGIDESAVAAVLREHYQDRPMTIYVGAIDEGWDVVADPVRVFRGYADNATVTVADDQAHVRITAESRMARWGVPNGSVYSDAEQQRRWPGDKFFEFTSQAAEKVHTVAWPSAGFFRR